MAQIIPFPGTELPSPPAAPPLSRRVKPAIRDGHGVISPIRKHWRIPKMPRKEDEHTAMIARMAASYADKAYSEAQADPNGEKHRLMLHMAGIDGKLPKNNLRCIVSTLDEERDFDLRCAEVEVHRAQRELEDKREEMHRVLDPHAERDHTGFWARWGAFRDRVIELAETPARTYAQLERKRRIIGKTWLTATGMEWYDRLRAGCAADEAWLAQNRPKRRKGPKQ